CRTLTRLCSPHHSLATMDECWSGVAHLSKPRNGSSRVVTDHALPPINSLNGWLAAFPLADCLHITTSSLARQLCSSSSSHRHSAVGVQQQHAVNSLILHPLKDDAVVNDRCIARFLSLRLLSLSSTPGLSITNVAFAHCSHLHTLDLYNCRQLTI